MAKENSVCLGFAEKAPSWLLSSRFFRSKIGGGPSWLDLKNLPKPEEIACETCSRPMVLLCQLYAPIDDFVRAFHRTIFVFMCKIPSCHAKSSPFAVFRCQLPRYNEFFPADPPVERPDWESNRNASKYGNLCRACGARAEKTCSGCQRVSYCHRDHQTADWRARHKKECQMFSAESGRKFPESDRLLESAVLPEFEIVEEVVSDNEEEDSDVEEAEMAKFEKLKSEGKVGSTDISQLENGEEEEEKEDEVFVQFREEIRHEPDQVIRWSRQGQGPLWVKSGDQVGVVPDCESCGGERVFEAQVMPQMLHYLHLDSDTVESPLDWGTLAIFTCKNSCQDGGRSYTREYLWRQPMISK